MADFEAPSFSLGLDCDLFDSEPLITPVTQANDHSSSHHLSVAFAAFKDEHDEFEIETLVVDDSEPEYPDSHPKVKRLWRGIAMDPTPVPAKAAAELHSTAVIKDEDIVLFSSPEDRATDQHLHTQHHVVNQPVIRKQHHSNDLEPVFTGCNNMVFSKLNTSPLGGFHPTDSDSDSDDPYVNKKCDGSDSNSNIGNYDDLTQLVNKKQNFSNVWKDIPKAFHYFFHNDSRIQELVRSRLPNFSPLGNNLNIDLEQPGTSKIDYMGQFRFGETSKQAARTTKKNKSSTSRTNSRKLETEEMSQGWVNPRLGVNKSTKGAVKRKVRSTRQTAGHWLTSSDGKKVYVGKSGQELTGRVAYMQYKKESGLMFKKVKRKSFTKKKK